MDIVKINWIQTKYSQLQEFEDTKYYAFTNSFGSLLYIGIAHKQHVHDEINNTIKRLNLNLRGLSIWLGYIDKENTTFLKMSESIIRDAECLMIYTNQPTYNQQCKINYTGRRNFCVKTRGFDLIKRCVKCDENGKIYLTC
jgi:hypothetical protein